MRVSSIFIPDDEARTLMSEMRLFSARRAPPPLPPAPIVAALARDERLERWRSLTLEGNIAIEQRQGVRSRQLYEEALAVADALLAEALLENTWLAGNPQALALAPLLHGITCNNIVGLARLQGDRETAGIYLYRRAASLIAVVESPRAPLELRSRCLMHLEIASSGVYEYFEQDGMWDAAAAFSERVNAALFTLQRVE